MYVLERLPGYDIDDVKSQISNLKSSAESIGRQLRAWADVLQNSDIQGQRRITALSKKRYQAKKEEEEMDREIQASYAQTMQRLESEREARMSSSSSAAASPTESV